MRNLILYRERALAAFALTYHCHVNRDRDAHMEALSHMADPRMEAKGDYGLRNGQTVSIPMEETGGSFFVGVYTQEKSYVSDAIAVPAGTEDVKYKIITDFDGNKRLSFRVELL